VSDSTTGPPATAVADAADCAALTTPPAGRRALDGLLDALASSAPTPGAGPAVAWTCAVAAALIEMVTKIAMRDDDTAGSRAAALARGDRARQLRQHALELADADAAAYQLVLAARRERGGPGRSHASREALSAAADPPLAIAETAAELCLLAADAAEHARGGVGGEAVAAAILAEAATAACVPMLRLNLAGNPDDPRLTRGIQFADDARLSRTRATVRLGGSDLDARAGTST
jgi:formiminotetrahydrofolate cyclodeaminase